LLVTAPELHLSPVLPQPHLVCSPELRQLLCADAATEHQLPAQAYVVHVVVGVVQGQEVKEAPTQPQLIYNAHIAAIHVKDATKQLQQQHKGMRAAAACSEYAPGMAGMLCMLVAQLGTQRLTLCHERELN
jgi:hypothetical protein